MSRIELLESPSELRSTGVDIDFIDNRLTGMVTFEEWKNDWSLSDEEQSSCRMLHPIGRSYFFGFLIALTTVLFAVALVIVCSYFAANATFHPIRRRCLAALVSARAHEHHLPIRIR